MGNSRKKKRKRGRTTPKAPQSEFLRPFEQIYQKDGAEGLMFALAELAGRDGQRHSGKQHPETPELGYGPVLVSVLTRTPGKLAANMLAVVSEIWPDEVVRDNAAEALSGRRSQVAGMLRSIHKTNVGTVLRHTDEYRDAQMLFIEVRLCGKSVVTLAVQTCEFDASWLELALYDAPAEAAANQINPPAQPGKPRPEITKLTVRASQLQVWLATAKRGIESEGQLPVAMFEWVARMLKVDACFPDLPAFLSEPSDNPADDSGPYLSEELDAFLGSGAGSLWNGWKYEELIDHLCCYETGSREMIWSPARVEDFLLFSNHAFVDRTFALPGLLRCWVRHCASVTRQRKPLLRAVLDEIDNCEAQFMSRKVSDDAA